MNELEKLADTLHRFNPEWSARYREMCREIADDLGLRSGERDRFLYESGANEPQTISQ
jgi:hypothetical protein